VAHSPSCWVGSAVFSMGLSSWGMTWITHLDLLPRSIVSGALPLLPLYVFAAWIRKPFTLVLFLNCVTVYWTFNFYLHSLGVYFEHVGAVLLLPVVISVFVLHYLQFSYSFLSSACLYVASFVL
jgi:hypothetical protein